MGCNDGGINFIVVIVVVPNVTDRIVGGKLVYSMFSQQSRITTGDRLGQLRHDVVYMWFYS